MITLRDITVVKSGKSLLNNFDITFETNEHYVISGANGSGKTTLLELLAGSLHASKGEVQYDFISGTTWEERFWERKRKVHYIPTHAIQSFLKSGGDLYYQQRYYTSSESSVCVKDILGADADAIAALHLPETLDIQYLMNVDVTRLSNGQLKKVLLLHSLLKEKPVVMLLDYPFEGLDLASREDLSEFIDFIARTYSIQIILVDHHHHVPSVITKRIILNNFSIVSEENITLNKKHDAVQYTSLPLRANNEAVVEIKDLKIQYGDKVILKDFNWKIKRGERWALTGKNGSGKTTVFSLIFADHPMAYSQQVYLFGKRRGSGESIWDIKKRITYLGPELINYLNPKIITVSARQYITSLNKGLNAAMLEELIHYFNAASFIDMPVNKLSSGQLQLMLVMSSFLADKELLLLDEPFQFLDPEHKDLMCRYLQTHLHADTTLVLITHYEEDIKNWTQQTKKLS